MINERAKMCQGALNREIHKRIYFGSRTAGLVYSDKFLFIAECAVVGKPSIETTHRLRVDQLHCQLY